MRSTEEWEWLKIGCSHVLCIQPGDEVSKVHMDFWSDHVISVASLNTLGMEDIGLIDAVHIREAAAHTERVRWALDNAENPDLLRILIDYYLTKGSKGALKILTTLKSSHAQVEDVFSLAFWWNVTRF